MLLDLIDGLPPERFDIHVVAGTQTGSEGSFWQDLQERLPTEKIHSVTSMVRQPNPLLDLLAYRKMVSIFKKIRPDIVHTHTSKAGVLGRFAARKAGVERIVHSTHGLIYDPGANIPGVKGWLTGLFLRLDQAAGAFTDVLITLSEQETGDAIRLQLGSPSKIHAISNGIPLKAFAAIERDPDSWKVPHLRLGIAGRLNKEKGHGMLLRSFKSLADQFSGLFLKVAGDGPLRETLKQQAADLGIADRVLFLGYQKDMVEFLEGVDVFVLSSHYEGFGLVLVEAMGAGLPVVATDVGGVREVMIDGQTGLVVPSDQEDQLAMGIEYFINHPHLAYEYGQKGRVHAMERFSTQQMVRRHLDLYRQNDATEGESVVPSDHVTIDLHMHSHHSYDSKTKIDVVLEAARKKRVKAICVTDHDNMGGSFEASEKNESDVMIIKGMEITSEVGDIIALFIEKPIEALDLEGIVNETRAQGGLLYLPHPFRGRRSISLELIEAIDIFEICNGRSQGINYRDDSFGNREIVQFAQEYGLTGVGGSDAHKPAEYMRVLTYVPPFETEEELKSILKSGKIFPVWEKDDWFAESLPEG